jgi:hypothetical protein
MSELGQLGLSDERLMQEMLEQTRAKRNGEEQLIRRAHPPDAQMGRPLKSYMI